jgi:hypothetical protein
MFNASWFSVHKGEVGLLKLTKHPLMHGLGIYTDVDGVEWDIHCIVGAALSASGKMYVTARKKSENPNYYSTATDSDQCGFHKWLPYYFEVIN